jgi:hypothetical protein
VRRIPTGRRRGPVERALLGAEISLAYGRACLELRRRPIEQVVERLRGPGATGAMAAGEADLEEARRLGWAVVRTLRYLPGDTRCLRRSLVLLRLLARRGIGSRLVIAARGGPDFLAHAWIEHAGRPVLSPPDESFGRLVEL